MNELQSFLQIGSPRILVVGDLILDRYTWGNADRVSPEAPVLVLQADQKEVRLGGAASVAVLLRALGADVCLAGVVGNDPEGRIVRRLLDESGIDHSLVLCDEDRPTTTKERFIGRAAGRHAHQILRVDSEVRTPLSDDLTRRLLDGMDRQLPQAQALLISDYAKGVCTPRLLSELMAAARRHGRPVLVDPARITDYERYSGCDVLIPNRVEAAAVIGSAIDSGSEAISAAKQLQALCQAQAVIVKLDRDGMVLVDGEQSGTLSPTRAREVVDVTGAGDMVLAIVGLCRAAGLPLSEAVRWGNLAAGLEVERIGVAPVTRTEIFAEFLREQPTAQDKGVTLDEMELLAESYRRAGRRIVFTNGCFDLLHVGHVTCLREAARLGDVLVVGINSDVSVRRLKGPTRPIIAERDRAQLLAAMACVQHVLIFDDDKPLDLLRRIRPDVLAKGGTTPQVVGAEIVEGYGGRVVRTAEVPEVSTTRIESRLSQRLRADRPATPSENSQFVASPPVAARTTELAETGS